MNAKMLEAIKQSAAVPSMPQVVARILEVMQSPDFSYDDLVKALSVDPGTVSEVLRLVNSALFGLRNKVLSLRQALALLGPKRTRSLLLGRYLVDAMAHRKSGTLDMKYFWRRSLASAVAATHLADRVAPQLRDEAFLSALLADVGVCVLADAFPDKYAPLVAHYRAGGDRITPEQEHYTVGLTHAEVSAMVLSHWQLPELIAQAVNLQHCEAPGGTDAGTLGRALNASDQLAKLLCEIRPGPTSPFQATCMNAVKPVNLDPSALLEIIPLLQRDIDDLAGILRIDVIPTSGYAQLAGAVRGSLAESVA